MKELKVPFEVKEVSDEGVFSGYAAVFNNVDLGFDKILPGAFTKSLKKNKGVFPIYADHHKHIGYNIEAAEDKKGLFIKGQINLDVQEGREKHALAKQAKEVGGMMGLSIGYDTVKREYEGDVRVLKELIVYETSLTAIPMNPKANVTSVKRKDGELVLNFKEVTITDVREFETALRDAGVPKTKACAVASIVFGRSDTDSTELKESMENLLKILKNK